MERKVMRRVNDDDKKEMIRIVIFIQQIKQNEYEMKQFNTIFVE